MLVIANAPHHKPFGGDGDTARYRAGDQQHDAAGQGGPAVADPQRNRLQGGKGRHTESERDHQGQHPAGLYGPPCQLQP